MKKTFREIMGDARLLSGFLAFAVAGVIAVTGGRGNSWGFSLLAVVVACALAVVAITLLAKPKKTKTVISDTIDPRYRELIDVLGVTNETFARFYSPMLEQLPEHALAFAIRVIKCRRGVMLGTEKGQESVRRNRDRWTYAVFVVAISGVNRSDKEKAAAMTQVRSLLASKLSNMCHQSPGNTLTSMGALSV